jgi:hypothetical protein
MRDNWRDNWRLPLFCAALVLALAACAGATPACGLGLAS